VLEVVLRPGHRRHSAGPFGLTLLVALGVVLFAAPVRLTPVYARHVEGTLPRLLSDLLPKPFRGVDILAIEKQQAAEPAPFDYGISTTAATWPSRNVVIVMLESVRASSTGLYDSKLGNTPFLRELAGLGAMVEEIYAVAPRTSSAWVSIMHGAYPGDSDTLFLWGGLEEKLARTSSIPRTLRQYGYLRDLWGVLTEADIADNTLADRAGRPWRVLR
jgi:lipoteichoic acid synthase